MNEQQRGPGHQIVVGVDGSLSSKAAPQWAVRQAELTASRIEAVIVWHYPTMAGGYALAPMTGTEETSLEDSCAKTITEAVSDAVDRAGTVPVGTTGRDAARPGCSWTRPTELTCVPRARGITGVLLGSVSQH